MTLGHRESLIALTQEQILSESNFHRLREIEQFAEERGHATAELAIAWLLYNSAVSSVITGATNPEQVVANTGAANWHLTAEEYGGAERGPLRPLLNIEYPIL